MKNWFVKFLLCVAFLAVASHAQLVENPEPYTSGAPAPKTPVVNINHVENDEPMFAVEVHPISLLFNPLIWSNETVMFTVEGNINSNASIITRPFYKGEKISKKHEKGYVDVFGLSEGFRYYFDRGHKGWYTAAHFTFEYVSLMHSYDDSKYDRVEDSGNGIELGLYLGHRFRYGRHFVSSIDVGAIYSEIFVSKDGKDDVEDVTNVGIGLDINFTVGFAF